jgi:hypothetical protein
LLESGIGRIMVSVAFASLLNALVTSSAVTAFSGLVALAIPAAHLAQILFFVFLVLLIAAGVRSALRRPPI